MNRADLPDGWQDLLAGYALDNLSEAEREELNQLLANHPELKAELTAYRQALDQLPLALPQEAPAKRLETRLIEAIHQPAASSKLNASATNRKWRIAQNRPLQQRRWWTVVGSVLAVVALISLSIDNRRLRQKLKTRQAELVGATARIEQLQITLEWAEILLATLRQPNSQVYHLQGSERAEATGSLVMAPGHSEVALVANHLPTLSADQIYRLWAIDDSRNESIYCGQFNANATGTIRWTVPELRCVNNPNQVIITIDSVQAPPLPEGELVMKSQAF